MAEAVDALVTSGTTSGQVACRVMYRLAHHADMLYSGIQAQKQSPEWSTAQAVIKQKRQQVAALLHHALPPTWSGHVGTGSCLIIRQLRLHLLV